MAFGTAIIRTKKDGSIKIMDVELEESREVAQAQADRWNAKALPKNIRWAVVKIEVMEK